MEYASVRKCRTTIHPDPTDSPASRATSSTTSAGANRRRPRLRTRHEPVGTEVRRQRLRDADGAVRPLVVLEQGDDRAREGHPRGVEGMHELRLGARFAPEPDVRPPRLEVGEGAGTRRLEPGPDPRRPDLEIHGAGAAEAGVTRREGQ